MVRGGGGIPPGADRVRTWTTVLSGLSGATAGLMLGIAYRAFEDGQRNLALALGGLTVIMVVVLLFLVLLARTLATVLDDHRSPTARIRHDLVTAARIDDLESDVATLSKGLAELSRGTAGPARPATAVATDPPDPGQDQPGAAATDRTPGEGREGGEGQERNLASRSSTSK